MARVNPVTELCGNGDCPKFVQARGRCTACYNYLRKHGEERPEKLYNRTRSTVPHLHDPVDIAWFAGFYEGEGTIRTTTRAGCVGRVYISIQIASTDRDTLERCKKTFGGHICVKSEAKGRWKKAWQWTQSTSEYAYAISIAMLPQLASRRSTDLTRAIRAWIDCGLRAERPPSSWPDSRHDSLPTLEECFWGKVDRSGPCWRWDGIPDNNGYSKFFIIRHGKRMGTGAHRIAWEFVRGYTPGRLENECGDKACVFPDHWRECRANPKNRSLARAKKPLFSYRTVLDGVWNAKEGGAPEEGHPLDEAM